MLLKRGGGGGRVLLKRGGGAECCLRHCTTRRTVSYKASGPDASGMYDASYSVVQGVGARRVGDVRRVGRCRGPTRRKIPISTVVGASPVVAGETAVRRCAPQRNVRTSNAGTGQRWPLPSSLAQRNAAHPPEQHPTQPNCTKSSPAQPRTQEHMELQPGVQAHDGRLPPCPHRRALGALGAWLPGFDPISTLVADRGSPGVGPAGGTPTL